MLRLQTGEDGRELMAPSRSSTPSFLRPEERLPSEATAQGLYALGDGLLVVRQMARGRHLRAAQRRFARAAAQPLGREPTTYREHRRPPNDQDHRGRRRAEGLRRQQEGPRPKAEPRSLRITKMPTEPMCGAHGGIEPGRIAARGRPSALGRWWSAGEKCQRCAPSVMCLATRANPGCLPPPPGSGGRSGPSSLRSRY